MLGLGRMSLTNEDLQALRNEFATKADLERFATKDDLERFATKEDLVREISTLRDDRAKRDADLRHYMEILIEDLASRMKTMFDAGASRR